VLGMQTELSRTLHLNTYGRTISDVNDGQKTFLCLYRNSNGARILFGPIDS
jgi:hypothetical protein